MRYIVLLVLVSFMSIGCVDQTDESTSAAPQVTYTEMQLTDAGTLGVATGSIVIDSNFVVRKVNVTLVNDLNIVMGLEPTDDGATDWIISWTYDGELYSVRAPGHVDVVVTDDCAEVWISSDTLYGSAMFCAN